MAKIYRFYCPECGKLDNVAVCEVVDTVWVYGEECPADETKVICSCGKCGNLFYVVRSGPNACSYCGQDITDYNSGYHKDGACEGGAG